MRIYRFDIGTGTRIDSFGSNFILSRIVGADEKLVVNCFHLEPGGVVGRHEAVTSQLFLVVQGSGWVQGEGSARIPIEVNQAANWNKGEWHEAGTNSGLTAIVLEGEFLLTGDSMLEWNQ